MKKQILLTILLLASSTIIFAQINLVGSAINQETGQVEIVKWKALDSLSVMSYPTELNGYVYSSSVFNAYSSNYYLSGIVGNSGTLFSFNTLTNQTSVSASASLSNNTQIDMSTGRLYNLQADSVDYFSIYEFDVNTGIESLVGVIHEPGMLGFIADGGCFDSNDGILYYVGVDSTPGLTLYRIPVREPEFSYSKLKLDDGSQQYAISSIHYDNVNNTIYSLGHFYNPNGTSQANMIIEINKNTGEIIERGELTGFPYFLGGSSSFDQYTGSFLLVAFDSSFQEKMIVFDTYSNTYQAGFVPGVVSEIVCDNYSFALETYLTTSIQPQNKSIISVYPNPADERLTIEVNEMDKNGYYMISNLNGTLVAEGPVVQIKSEIQLQNFSKGIYFITLKNGSKIETRKIVVQ